MFNGGINIALKIPKSKYQETIAFYRDILTLDVQEQPINHPTVSKTHKVVFGNNTIWLDCVDSFPHSSVWLELNTTDMENAIQHLDSHHVKTCDEIEQIPENMHWIQDPAGTVFIVKEKRDGKN